MSCYSRVILTLIVRSSHDCLKAVYCVVMYECLLLQKFLEEGLCCFVFCQYLYSNSYINATFLYLDTVKSRNIKIGLSRSQHVIYIKYNILNKSVNNLVVPYLHPQ